jgi:hypothetical protein
MQAEVLVAICKLFSSLPGSSAVVGPSLTQSVSSPFVRWVTVFAEVFLSLLMHADDAIQSEKIMFNPA